VNQFRIKRLVDQAFEQAELAKEDIKALLRKSVVMRFICGRLLSFQVTVSRTVITVDCGKITTSLSAIS
jgi:hypothetical protein